MSTIYLYVYICCRVSTSSWMKGQCRCCVIGTTTALACLSWRLSDNCNLRYITLFSCFLLFIYTLYPEICHFNLNSLYIHSFFVGCGVPSESGIQRREQYGSVGVQYSPLGGRWMASDWKGRSRRETLRGQCGQGSMAATGIIVPKSLESVPIDSRRRVFEIRTLGDATVKLTLQCSMYVFIIFPN